MFYLTTHSTHFIYGYMASDMVKDHSDSEKGNPLPPHRLLLLINSKGSFICTIPDKITHTTAFVTPVVEHWLEREIAQWVNWYYIHIFVCILFRRPTFEFGEGLGDVTQYKRHALDVRHVDTTLPRDDVRTQLLDIRLQISETSNISRKTYHLENNDIFKLTSSEIMKFLNLP